VRRASDRVQSLVRVRGLEIDDFAYGEIIVCTLRVSDAINTAGGFMVSVGNRDW
jgi:hypothetical protein